MYVHTCISSLQLAPDTDISVFLSELLTKTKEFEEHKKVNAQQRHTPTCTCTCISTTCVFVVILAAGDNGTSVCFFSQFLEGMSQKILKGIEEAQTDISKEKQKKGEEVKSFNSTVQTVDTYMYSTSPLKLRIDCMYM